MSLLSEFDPANMLLEISNQVARQVDSEIFMQIVVSTIMQYTHASFISITMNDSGRGKVLQLIQNASGQSEVKGKSDEFRFFVSRDLVVRRVRYGRLEISFSNHNDLQQGDFLATLDTIADQLSLFAEIHSVRQQTTRLQAEVHDLSAAVKRSKVVARARNLVETARQNGNRALQSVRPARRLHPGLPAHPYGKSQYLNRSHTQAAS